MRSRVSKAFKSAYLCHEGPRYRLALGHGLRPEWLSKIVHGVIEVAPGDERVVAIGRQLGLRPHQCFELEEEQEEARS